jgi:hypothetical protein
VSAAKNQNRISINLNSLLIYESAKVAEAIFEKVSSGEVLIFARKPVLMLAAAERCAK